MTLTLNTKGLQPVHLLQKTNLFQTMGKC